MDQLVQDLRQSFRVLWKNPAFAAAAIAALTLGIGANTAIFTVVNAVLLRPIGLPDPDRLVYFMNVAPGGSGPASSPAKFLHYRSQTDVVSDVSAFTVGTVNYTGGTFPEQLQAGRVSANFFRLVGARFEKGRAFSPDEDLPNGEKTVVLSSAAWKTRFNSDPDIVGKSVSLDGAPYVVIGVLAPNAGFRELGGADPDVWTAFQFPPNSTDQGHYFVSLGRLNPGVTLEQAQAALRNSTTQYRERFPNAVPAQNSFGVLPVRELLVRNVRQSLLVLAGAVALVLLIACANVANLLLARASGRTREVAVRAAIGGSRGRIVRQLLTESLVMSTIGGVLGLALGMAGIRALLSVNTAGLPRVGDAGAFVGLDWRVAIFAVGISVLTGVVFGLMPALQTSRVDLTTSLKESSGRSGTGARQTWTRSILVITEVALATILLIGSALLIKSAAALSSVDPGFDATNVLTMRMALTDASFQSAERVEQMVQNGVERLRTVPGVEIVSAACCVPLQGGYGLPFKVIGRALTNGPFHGGANWMTVSPGYFEVFRIPVRRGRSFSTSDRAGSPGVAIVNEAFVRQFFPNEQALGQHLVIGRGGMREFAADPDREIIGIVGDSRDAGLNANPPPIMFVPQAQVPDAANALNMKLSPIAWIVRTRTDPAGLSAAIQEQLRQLTGLPVSQVQSMNDVVSVSTSRSRFNMLLMTIFGGSALVLAAIGIYGLMAYSVAQRRQEIGIRMALGAEFGAVRRMIMQEGMTLALIGTVVGLGASFALARFIAGFLFQTDKWDPSVFAGVPITLLLVALGSTWTPAARASRVDPVIALRAE